MVVVTFSITTVSHGPACAFPLGFSFSLCSLSSNTRALVWLPISLRAFLLEASKLGTQTQATRKTNLDHLSKYLPGLVVPHLSSEGRSGGRCLRPSQHQSVGTENRASSLSEVLWEGQQVDYSFLSLCPLQWP